MLVMGSYVTYGNIYMVVISSHSLLDKNNVMLGIDKGRNIYMVVISSHWTEQC